MEEKNPLSFADYLTVVIKRRHFIVKTFLIVTTVALIISLIIPPKYTATATILPPNPQQEAMFGLLQSSNLSSLSGLSALGGVLPGATTPSDLFAAILRSGQITGKIIRKYDLKKVFRTKTMSNTYEMLNSITRIGVTPEGIVSVSVTWYDRHLAADIANSFIEELDKFNTATAMTVGKKYRMFVEQRLQENKDTLIHAENALRVFQEKHRTIAIEDEIKSAIETIAKLKGEIILREVQKGALESFSNANNPYVQSIDNELREFRRQLSKIELGEKGQNVNEFGVGFSVPFSQLPGVSIEYARLIRDVKVQEVIFEILTQQYEQAKIMELKDTPTVQFLDKASPPERRSSPKRAQIVIFAAFFSLVLGIISSFSLESYEQLKKRSIEYTKWADIFRKITKDLVNLKTKFLQFFGIRINH